MALVVSHGLENALRTEFIRFCLLGLAVACGLLLSGCDDDVQVGGVGASVGLPTAFTSGASDTADIGVGNVHWVGNPRW